MEDAVLACRCHRRARQSWYVNALRLVRTRAELILAAACFSFVCSQVTKPRALCWRRDPAPPPALRQQRAHLLPRRNNGQYSLTAAGYYSLSCMFRLCAFDSRIVCSLQLLLLRTAVLRPHAGDRTACICSCRSTRARAALGGSRELEAREEAERSVRTCSTAAAVRTTEKVDSNQEQTTT
jgi:hypothetical protein